MHEMGEYDRRACLRAIGAAGAVGLAGMTGATGNGAPTNDAERAIQDGTRLSYALQESIVAMDFALAYDFTTNKVTNNVWDTLVTYTYDDPPELTNWLASNVETEGDTSYVYELRDATFHNGEPVTAGDVKASFERLRNPDVGSPLSWALSNVREGDDGIEVVDEQTVRFNLEEQSAVWQYMPGFVGIAPASAMDEHGVDFGRNPGTTVGSGPFSVESWNQGNQIELVRHDDYWNDDLPMADGITFSIVPEGSSRVTGLSTGEHDVVGNLPPQQWQQVSNMDNARIERGTTFLEYKLSMQNQREPWQSDKQLRQALAYATNWDQIIENVYFGTVVRQEGPLPQNMPWHNDELEIYEHDPERAQELYDQSGGIDRPIEFIATQGTQARVAVIVQEQWRDALGVEVNVNQMPYEQLLPRIENGEYDIQYDGWGSDYPDPDGQLYSQYHSDFWPPNNNESWYENGEVDDLLEQARTTTDEAEREQLYREIQRVVHEDVPAIWGVVVEQGFGVNEALSFPEVTPMWYWQDVGTRIGPQ